MKHLIVIIFIGLMSYSVSGQYSGANFAFTDIPVSTLSAAHGGSNVAFFQGDVAQTADNPAFLDSAMHQSVSLGYLNYVSTINQATLSYGHLFDSIGFGSAYLRYFDYGTFQETDETGRELGEFKAADYELGVSFARPYANGFTYGVTFKQVFSSMYQLFAYGMAVDVGGYYRSKSGNFTAGTTINNIGAKLIDYNSNGPEAFSLRWNAGITKKFEKAPLLFGIQYNDLQRWDLAANDADAIANNTVVDELTGEESRRVVTLDNLARHLSATVAFVPSDKFNLMLGYNFRRRLELSTLERPALVGFSFGARVQIKRIGIQYALASYHLGGASNHFTLTTNLNEWVTRKSAK